MDPGPCRLLYVAGGTSKAEEHSSKEFLPRQESENSTGFEGTVIVRHSPRVRITYAGV